MSTFCVYAKCKEQAKYRGVPRTYPPGVRGTPLYLILTLEAKSLSKEVAGCSSSDIGSRYK
eukprot:scaffold10792_cov120-Skeletonema_marinoi.AAC.3